MNRTHGRIGTTVTVFLAMTITALTLAIAATPAFGHTKLVSSDPRDGSAVPSPMASVSLVFTEQLQPSVAKVVIVGPKQAVIGVTRLRVHGRQLAAAVTGASAAGRYQLSYHVVSTDGHPITGTLTFRVLPGAQGGAAASAPELTRPAPGGGGTAPLAASRPPGAAAAAAEPSQRQSVVSALLLMALVPVLVAVGARRISWSNRAR